MRKGFACGIFDLFHAGHVLMLRECKEQCDYLVVALNSGQSIDSDINPDKNQPIFTIEQRKLILESCRYVDEVLVYHNEEELEKILTEGDYQVRFLGDDYRNREITAPDAVAEIYYNDRSHGLSTSKFRKMIEKNNNE